MNTVKAGYMKFRGKAERVREHMLEALNTERTVAQHMMDKISHARHHDINGRIIVEDKQISEGGFAFVWAVRDVHSHEEFAVKKIICQDKEALSMARREIALLERLPVHPNLVRYFGHTIATTETRAKEAVLLFECCTGGHLLDMLERHQGKLSEDRILDVFCEICTAVELLHSLAPPIQHRDLKVENVLVGADRRYKLCDFGSWSDECTNPSRLDKKALGALQEHINRYTTMMYRPPEMVDFYQEFQISEKVDIWMLGCILFTLMFCRHPFQDESPLAIANARYFLPSVPAYSEKLQDLTHWLLARDPMDRPSATELLGAVKTFKDPRSLRLPQAVVQKREQHKRLYESSSVDRKSTGPVKKREKKEKSEKAWIARAATSEDPGAWGDGLQARPDAAGIGWPTVTFVPEPSRAWANFDGPGSSPETRSSSRSSKPEEEDATAGDASWCPSGSWDPFMPQRQPSASSRARPSPLDERSPAESPSYHYVDGRLTDNHTGRSARSGCSERSAHSTKSSRSADACRSSPSRARSRRYRSEQPMTSAWDGVENGWPSATAPPVAQANGWNPFEKHDVVANQAAWAANPWPPVFPDTPEERPVSPAGRSAARPHSPASSTATTASGPSTAKAAAAVVWPPPVSISLPAGSAATPAAVARVPNHRRVVSLGEETISPLMPRHQRPQAPESPSLGNGSPLGADTWCPWSSGNGIPNGPSRLPAPSFSAPSVGGQSPWDLWGAGREARLHGSPERCRSPIGKPKDDATEQLLSR